MTQGFLLGLGIFGGLLVASLILNMGVLVARNIGEIAKVVGLFAGVVLIAHLGVAGCAVVVAGVGLLAFIGWSAAKATTAVKRRARTL